MTEEPSIERSSRQCARRRSVSCSQGQAHCTGCIKGTRLLGAQRRMLTSSGKNRHQQHETEDDTEVGMLSGVSRKRSIRSNPCWFTEFCKSQCLSHFAAPFIVVRAETSVAESCKEAITVWRLPPTGKMKTTHTRRLKKPAAGNTSSTKRPEPLQPPSNHKVASRKAPKSESSHLKVHGENCGKHVCE